MTHHDQHTDQLSAYLDGELDAAAAARLEAHLVGCADCRSTVEALRSIVTVARSLADHEPPEGQWDAIARRLDEEAVVALPRRRFAFSLPQLAAASIALMLSSGGAVWLATRGAPAVEPTPAVAVEAAPAGTLVSFDATGYEATIAELEAALAATRDRLSPETLAAVERSLAAIDAAIDDAMTALRNDPHDPFLVRHLERTMVRKMDILRRATPRAPAQT